LPVVRTGCFCKPRQIGNVPAPVE